MVYCRYRTALILGFIPFVKGADGPFFVVFSMRLAGALIRLWVIDPLLANGYSGATYQVLLCRLKREVGELFYSIPALPPQRLSRILALSATVMSVIYYTVIMGRRCQG